MEFEIYFFTQVCVHNNFSKWKICKSLYVTSRSDHELPNLGEHESYLQHFSFNAQGTFFN